MGKILVSIIAGGIAGLLVGLIPLFIGINKSQRDMGVISLIACWISGILLGLILAIPVSILCSYIINSKAKNKVNCPYCKEVINKDATLCKHCKETLQEH